MWLLYKLSWLRKTCGVFVLLIKTIRIVICLTIRRIIVFEESEESEDFPILFFYCLKHFCFISIYKMFLLSYINIDNTLSIFCWIIWRRPLTFIPFGRQKRIFYFPMANVANIIGSKFVRVFHEIKKSMKKSDRLVWINWRITSISYDKSNNPITN